MSPASVPALHFATRPPHWHAATSGGPATGVGGRRAASRRSRSCIAVLFDSMQHMRHVIGRETASQCLTQPAGPHALLLAAAERHEWWRHRGAALDAWKTQQEATRRLLALHPTIRSMANTGTPSSGILEAQTRRCAQSQLMWQQRIAFHFRSASAAQGHPGSQQRVSTALALAYYAVAWEHVANQFYKPAGPPASVAFAWDVCGEFLVRATKGRGRGRERAGEGAAKDPQSSNGS